MDMSTSVRAFRGATTASKNESGAITDATHELLEAMLERNGLSPEEIISIVFTATPDLDAGFPALAARSLGLGEVPLLCAVEMDVPGALPRCVRILMHANTGLDRAAVRHVYLRDARNLRTDLPEN